MFLPKWVGTSNTKINATNYIIWNTKIATFRLRNPEPNWTNLSDYVIYLRLVPIHNLFAFMSDKNKISNTIT